MATLNESNITDTPKSNEESSERFDIQLLHDSLAKCCTDNDDLDMEQYLIAFREMYRFFSLLGSVFGFVASDILSKICILEEYRQSETSDQYSTVQSMVEHETVNNIINDHSRPSGCRTLLRLHRSLEFIMSFMKDFGSADNQAKSSNIAQKCYKETLAKHHPWLVQKGACFAMYTLPAKQQFIEKVKGESCSEQEVSHYGQLMYDIATVSKRVYDETEKLYEANGILNLP